MNNCDPVSLITIPPSQSLKSRETSKLISCSIDDVAQNEASISLKYALPDLSLYVVIQTKVDMCQESTHS